MVEYFITATKNNKCELKEIMLAVVLVRGVADWVSCFRDVYADSLSFVWDYAKILPLKREFWEDLPGLAGPYLLSLVRI
jgi:hypothetical protein